MQQGCSAHDSAREPACSRCKLRRPGADGPRWSGRKDSAKPRVTRGQAHGHSAPRRRSGGYVSRPTHPQFRSIITCSFMQSNEGALEALALRDWSFRSPVRSVQVSHDGTSPDAKDSRVILQRECSSLPPSIELPSTSSEGVRAEAVQSAASATTKSWMSQVRWSAQAAKTPGPRDAPALMIAGCLLHGHAFVQREKPADSGLPGAQWPDTAMPRACRSNAVFRPACST